MPKTPEGFEVFPSLEKAQAWIDAAKVAGAEPPVIASVVYQRAVPFARLNRNERVSLRADVDAQLVADQEPNAEYEGARHFAFDTPQGCAGGAVTWRKGEMAWDDGGTLGAPLPSGAPSPEVAAELAAHRAKPNGAASRAAAVLVPPGDTGAFQVALFAGRLVVTHPDAEPILIALKDGKLVAKQFDL